ncbi:LysM peptidoglycan-binding domain-containing protein [Rubrivirga marina]|uniref:LysM domain-containing protein n=1 Tax=Rubrivirga marina TaxID=1196024 RepID=A0A271IZ86_9BACT|nr:LysM peptidoglycan-binding domain-containing protein [Rubrivirga marina]PAP75809.1 hypothetical protein BSZ37_04805 [Rubrivirga marina]
MRAAVLVLLLLAPSASAQVAARLADLRLETAVRLALVDDARTRALDVAVAARDGGVEVRGDVPPTLQPLVAEIARGVRGVRVVGGAAVPDRPAPSTDRAAAPLRVQPVPEVERSAAPVRPTSTDAGPTYHTVERGDTLFSLARRYDTTVQAILDLNGRDSTDIRIGQRLRVR